MKTVITIVGCLLLLVNTAWAQTYSLKGKVTDKATGEGLIGATVQVLNETTNTGAATDVNGNYVVGNLQPGAYTVNISYVGFVVNTSKITIVNQDVTLNSRMVQDAQALTAVEVTANVAVERETPVAFSAINELQIRENLGGRDLPLILNETPGVYATQSGGGTGDSEIAIRGFKQENVAVMVNGVPVNDMENGAVYWSNWDLGDVTKSMQVQRGLSASKLAVPSVGGTINVITKGFESKEGGLVRQEIGTNGYYKGSIMYSTGVMENDWSATVYGARRRGNGWVEGTFDDAWTYFGSISKRIGNHTISLTGLGSPQKHGQRSFARPISTYSVEKAREFGASGEGGLDAGFDFNTHWNELNRYTINGTDTIHNRQMLNERQNYYHKPQVNLNHFWNVSDRLFISNVLYGSHGNGGGIGGAVTANPRNNLTDPLVVQSSTMPADAQGRTNFQQIYNNNFNQINRSVDTVASYSNRFLRANVNNHKWYGFITSADYKLTDQVTLSGGVDGRFYVGEHYQKVYDLLGGDYTLDNAGQRNYNADPTRKLGEGDKLRFNYDGKTRWLGGYTMAEFKSNLVSAFISGTLSHVGYKRIDYFRPKVVELGDTTLSVAFDRPVTYNGTTYTNADGKFIETDWVNLLGYSVKGGANYNLTEHNNIFVNLGYISRAPFFKFVFDINGVQFNDINNERIVGMEVGYGINRKTFKANLNAYNTFWFDRASSTTGNRDGELVYNNIRNIDARHIGVELEIAQQLFPNLDLNAAISLGDWRWNSTGEVTVVNEANEIKEVFNVNLKGIHVGGSAQNQFMMGLRYEPVRNLYIRPAFLLFAKHYSDFIPENYRGEGGTDTYRLPTSRSLDIHSGYKVKLSDKLRLGFNASVLNVLNEFYVTNVPARGGIDATNPGNFEVFFNRGRMWNLGINLEF